VLPITVPLPEPSSEKILAEENESALN